jgi:hypothetical protein
MFLLNEDIDALEHMIKKHDIGLVCIDPITAFMGKIDSHRATDVRSQLSPLADLARRMDVAISAVTHPPKAASQRAIDHFIGSQAFIAASRIGHLCLEEIEREEGKPVRNDDGSLKLTGRNLFTTARISAGPKSIATTLAYEIKEVALEQHDATTGEVITAPYVVWDPAPVSLTADQALAGGKGDKPQAPDVCDFLKLILNNGPVAQKKIEEYAAQRGISIHQLNRMKTKMGVVSEKTGFGGAEWVWSLPENDPNSEI